MKLVHYSYKNKFTWFFDYIIVTKKRLRDVECNVRFLEQIKRRV